MDTRHGSGMHTHFFEALSCSHVPLPDHSVLAAGVEEVFFGAQGHDGTLVPSENAGSLPTGRIEHDNLTIVVANVHLALALVHAVHHAPTPVERVRGSALLQVNLGD